MFNLSHVQTSSRALRTRSAKPITDLSVVFAWLWLCRSLLKQDVMQPAKVDACLCLLQPTALRVPSHRLSSRSAPAAGASPRAAACTAAELSASLGITGPAAFRLQQQFAAHGTQRVAQRVVALHGATHASVEDMALIMSKEPRLWHLPLEQVAEAYAALCAVMQLPAREVGALAVFAPALLCASARDIADQHHALQQATGLSTARLQEVR